MTLVVESSHGVGELVPWVTEAFSSIPNRNTALPNLADPLPFTPANCGKLVRYVPVEDKDEMSVVWALPVNGQNVKTKPLFYFQFLLEHEGGNSLQSYLIDRDLATKVSASPGHRFAGFSMMELNIKLTSSGIENYEKVIEAIFQFL